MIIALLGKIKRESNDTAHIILCVSVISPDINVKRLLRRLINVNTKLGLRDGPTISGDTGKLLEPSDLDEMVIELLMEYHSENRELFPVDMDTQEKIRNSYQYFRTFRRTSDTIALEKKVNESDIDIVNRWKTLNTAKERRPGRAMRQNYAQLELLMEPFLRYTSAM